jgi:hypothetical protein
MSTVSYIANGFIHTPTEKDPRYGLSEVRLFNPTQYDTKVNITVYYENKPPAQIPEFDLKAEGIPLLVFPDMPYSALHVPKIFNNCGAWGAKIVSDTILIVDHILLAGRRSEKEKGQSWPEMMFQGENAKFRGACANTLATTRLAKLWYFADGNRIKKSLPLSPKDPWLFNESEWYHILNPNKREATVTMKCFYGDGTRDTFSFKIGAERGMIIDNYDLVKPQGFGIKFISTEPVAIGSERFIYGLHSIEEWGMQLHTPRSGVPAPLEWNEEVE